MTKLKKVIISGGGTGGHIFPAIAIANEIQAKYPNAEILFVGAEGKMEMEKVPQAGYQIIGLPIRGLQRKLTLENLKFPFKLMASLFKAKKIVKTFQPDVAIGVGGYASAAIVRVAAKKGVPTLVQEQNSFPGITNKWLAKKAKKICVAYDGLERFFPKEKIVKTGNPVRNHVVDIKGKKEKGIRHFGLLPNKKTVLVIGGSLGAGTINNSLSQRIQELLDADMQVIWQCGKFYFENLKPLRTKLDSKQVYLNDFIFEMDLAYAAADYIVSRAGAMSVSELCLVGKPTILVPSPNVSEDHQTKNAMALVQQNAALLVKDSDAVSALIPKIMELNKDFKLQESLSENILKLGVADAPARILNEIEKIVS
ncbi:undecaprenyldiphospho-muramoylpentapeptide beta-N-acetylglucosaminyltransferase [Putridiphycobacter roseus]|uniref:UDP-N-acetylglucosamine--N-acetylmuramyl-(pentapeptide) pyrophosphoryl-undecaprenol N-acetylglucosamine transferase n=1 Tax=Putridiphycobacter roseus TaxID=2219161 RepID=A0A2W1NL38_9FLAO|nr:undecaprenyldiphospho-muramoylpentapeptide beta-N-acetylglucosaminyltransferase [Putridiphycobacter roseus]PZE18566.1 undecaprenyldiphospho-muramoylpentapeptide beta-N-acetylglucosaminyltransferase [Putridiphycobacter roseus]